MTDIIDTLLNEREMTYGDFVVNAEIAQATQNLWRSTAGWGKLEPEKRYALEMIAIKISRILSGDPNLVDSWDDIAGYARLVSAQLDVVPGINPSGPLGGAHWLRD